jgi:hypothetical protein
MPKGFTLTVLICVAPSKKVTVPRGAPVGTGEMVAVNETA